jgi:hypothetical protein
VNRSQLEHVIRAAAAIAGDTDIVVIGSQAILGRYPEAPVELLVSADVDLYPRNHPERADLIEGSIGELGVRAGGHQTPPGRTLDPDRATRANTRRSDLTRANRPSDRS